MKTIKFNKTTLDNIPTPEKRTRLYSDEVKGLVLEITTKGAKSLTNFLAKIQYYIFLCKEIFKMVDFTKYPEVNSDNYERYQHGFILRILEEIPEISQTDQVKIANNIKLKPKDQKKYGVNQFVNLMGCNSPKEYEKARKLINF